MNRFRKLFGLLGILLILSGCGAEGEMPREIRGEKIPAGTSGEETGKERGTVEAGGSGDENEIGEEIGKEGRIPEEADTGEEGGASEETGTSGQADDDTVSIRMVGDILLHTPVEEACRQEDGTYDYSAIFAHTEELIREADIALVNQEVIIGGTELGISGYPAFNASQDLMEDLADAGFDVICHATNHALDKGGRGIRNTLSGWESRYPDLTILGIHDSASDQDTVEILEVNGIRIAFLNYTYGTNGIDLPSDMPYAVDLLEKSRVTEDLAYAEEHADFTVVCPHWGTEYRLQHSQDQENWSRIFLEGGADLVLGTHPHVIQEIDKMEDEEHEMLIYYSLGNFVNWTSGTGAGVADRMLGGMADVTIRREEDGEVAIAEYGVIPLVCHVTSGAGGVTVYPLYEYTDALGAENEITAQDPDFSAAYCRDLAEEVWGLLGHVGPE